MTEIPASRNSKNRAPRNRTLDISDAEAGAYRRRIVSKYAHGSDDQVINADAFEALKDLPERAFDLLLLIRPTI